VSRKTLEIGISSAVIEFNEGKTGIEEVMKRAGLTVRKLQSAQNKKVFKKHTVLRARKSTSPLKNRRKTLRAICQNLQNTV